MYNREVRGAEAGLSKGCGPKLMRVGVKRGHEKMYTDETLDEAVAQANEASGERRLFLRCAWR